MKTNRITTTPLLATPVILLLLFLWPLSGLVHAQPFSSYDYTTNIIDSWFHDTNGWSSDLGFAPVSFTNLSAITVGGGAALYLDGTTPAWLQYSITETDGTNSATCLPLDVGSAALWYAPSWSSLTEGGTGPGPYGGRLLEVGAYTPDASFGWWSLYLDAAGTDLFFTVQPGDGTTTTYLTAPIAWTSNYWHCVLLSYCASNTSLYLDGALATNGPGLTAWPGSNALAGGFYIGSDSNGVVQAQGAYADICTFDIPLDASTANQVFNDFYPNLVLTPSIIIPKVNLASAPSTTTNAPVFRAVMGPGCLQYAGSTNWVASTNFWLTNIVARPGSNGTTLTFTLAGGTSTNDGTLYDIFGATALSGNSITNSQWSWLGQSSTATRCMISNMPNTAIFLVAGSPRDDDGDGLTTAFEELVSHSDPSAACSICAGIEDWWIWLYFGSLNESPTNLDSQGLNTLLYDYTNGLDPNVITFTVSATNRYVNQTAAPLQLNVQVGTPGSYAVLVNDSNPADATWLPYPGSNIVANLPSTDGVYKISVGLRGLPSFAQQTWQTVQLTKDTVGPMLVVTSPTVSTTAQPTIQLQGYTTKPLSAIRYDLSNAVAVVTNQTGSVKAEYFDPALFVFTTNWIQCYDIDLANGLNLITVRVSDWAGNTSTTNVAITLDYSTATNPVAQIIWPQDGSQICAGSFTCRGTLDDPCETVTAQITDTNGNLSVVNGIVGRNGIFWLQNLPLNSGPNTLAIAITNAAGLGIATNITVTQSVITLSINPVPQAQLWQPSVNLTGTVSDPSCTVSANGASAVNNGDGTWSAPNVPSSPGGVASFDLAAHSGGADSLNNTNTDKPVQIIVTNYFINWTNSFTTSNGGGGSGHQPLVVGLASHSEQYSLLWQEDTGTTASETISAGDQSCTTNFTWPADEYILNVRNPSSNGVASDTCSTTTNQSGPPAITLEHCIFATNAVVFGGTNSYSRTAQALLTLLTGGIGPLHQQDLFQISGSATAITNPATLDGYSVSPNQIQMGELGSLGADSNLWSAIQDNETKTITPTVQPPLDPDYYLFSAGATKYKLEITSPYQTNGMAIVGEAVKIYAAMDGGLAVSNYQWTVPGKMFTQYYALYSLAELRTDLPVTNSQVGFFYWADGGNKQVWCSAVWNGFNISNSVCLTVVRPIVIITNLTGQIAADKNYKSWGTWLHFGDYTVNPGFAGIVISNVLTMPTEYYNGGSTNYQVQWVQLVNDGYTSLKDNGAWWHLGPPLTNAVLDTYYPCPQWSAGATWTTDSPGTALLDSSSELSITNETFTTWLMFMPTGGPFAGKWVPLKTVDWGWNGSALNNGTINSPNWTLASSSIFAPVVSDSTAHPIWNDNITNHLQSILGK